MNEWMAALEWGDVPTWLSSLGGIGALIAASIAAKASLNVLRIESDRDKDADERAQRAQADLVAAWLTTEDETDWNAWHLCVINESKIPIFEFVVDILSTADDEAYFYEDVTVNEDNITRRHLPVVGPGRTSIPIPELLEDLTEEESLEQLGFLHSSVGVSSTHEVWITFRDAAGIRWVRSGTGNLRRRGPNEYNSPAYTSRLDES